MFTTSSPSPNCPDQTKRILGIILTRTLPEVSESKSMLALLTASPMFRHHDKKTKKADMRKAKAHAPTAEELDSELARYMGHEYVAKKLDEELDAYFKSGDAESH